MKFEAKSVVVLLALAAMSIGAAQASTLQLNYTSEFSGGQAPAGAAPWITAVFDDFGGSGSVRLTVSTAGFTDTSFISEFDLNLDTALNPASLVLTFNSGLSTGPAAGSITLGTDCCMADGDGKYDIGMGFPTSGSRFTAGETVVYDITGIASLTAASFNFLSTFAGGHGPFLAAAHVQNTTGACGVSGCTSSGWVSADLVPVPAAAWLFGSALGLLGLRRRTN